MERASEGSRFNQTGCGHSTASATAFVPNAESRQRPAIEQRCSRTKEPNEAIGFCFFNILVQNTQTQFLSRETVYNFTLVQSSGFTGSIFLDLFNTFKVTWHPHIFQTFTLTPLPSFSCCSDCSSLQT